MGAPTADAPIIQETSTLRKSMKKVLGILFSAAVLSLLSVSCRKVVHDKCTGLVDEINDSAMVVKVDGSKVKFDILQAKFSNGAVTFGDSVIVHYVGDLDDSYAVAELVYLMIRPSKTVPVGVVDTTLELLTRPAEGNPSKDIDQLIETAKRLENMQKK